MIDTCVIYDDFVKDVSDNYFRQKKLLGMTILERVILTANKSGVKKFLILLDKKEQDDSLVRRIKKNKSIIKKKLKMNFYYLNENKIDKVKFKDHFLFVNSNSVFDYTIFDEINDIKLNAKENLILLDSKLDLYSRDKDILKVKTDAKITKLKSIGYKLKSYNAIYSGISVLSQKIFTKLLKSFRSADKSGKFDVLKLEDTKILNCTSKLSKIVVNDRIFKHSQKYLLKSMRKPTDGFISRNFNRYVSLFLSKYLLKLKITPNQISFGNLGIGIVAAVILALGKGYWPTLLAAILFQFTSIVDGCDGEVAKLSFSDSDKGAWIDTMCDQLGYLTFFIGLPIGLYRFNILKANPNVQMGTLYLILGGLLLISIVLMFYLMTRYVRKTSTGGSMLKIIQDIETASKEKGIFGLMNKIVFKASFIFRRDFFAFAVMVLCIFNLLWLVMWIITVLCLTQVLYLIYFSNRQIKKLIG